MSPYIDIKCDLGELYDEYKHNKEKIQMLELIAEWANEAYKAGYQAACKELLPVCYED